MSSNFNIGTIPFTNLKYCFFICDGQHYYAAQREYRDRKVVEFYKTLSTTEVIPEVIDTYDGEDFEKCLNSFCEIKSID